MTILPACLPAARSPRVSLTHSNITSEYSLSIPQRSCSLRAVHAHLVPLNFSKDNISLYSVALTYVLAMVPHGFLEVSYFIKFGRWQNVSPR